MFDPTHRKCSFQPLELRMLTAFSQCSLICMGVHAHILPVYIFWPRCTSLRASLNKFFVIPSLCVYMNLGSMFPSLNVVKAGLNRMQVGCNISLYKTYRGGQSVTGLKSLYSGCLDSP